MCGFIACIHDQATEDKEPNKQVFKQMNELIAHRGPDDEGFFEDEHVQFGFRQLSILDEKSGQQPLSYENERYWLIFNGDIFNAAELREELMREGKSLSISF